MLELDELRLLLLELLVPLEELLLLPRAIVFSSLAVEVAFHFSGGS